MLGEKNLQAISNMLPSQKQMAAILYRFCENLAEK